MFGHVLVYMFVINSMENGFIPFGKKSVAERITRMHIHHNDLLDKSYMFDKDGRIRNGII